MTETLPQSPEDTSHVDPETADDSKTLAERPDERILSPMAQRLRRITDRVGTFLEDYSLNKAHGDALTEDHSRTVEAQSDAFASYEDNIAISEKADSYEKRRRGAKVLRSIGNKTLNFLEGQGIIPLRGRWHKQGGLSGFIAKKYVAAQKNKQERIDAGFLNSERDHEIAEASLPEDERIEHARTRAVEKASEARAHKIARKEASPTREHVGAAWENVRSAKRSVGSSVLNFFASNYNRATAVSGAWKDRNRQR